MFSQFIVLGIPIYTFWLSLSICFILFFWMLYRLSLKLWINTNFFLNNIFFYFISMFIFSRLFYVISEWRDFKFVFEEWSSWYLKFFLMQDYNFSLIWWIFWFLLVLFFQIKKYKIRSEKYIDAIVLAFLFAWIIWYLWAFLGWVIWWKPTNLPIWISYNNDALSSSKWPAYVWPLFPLWMIYSILSFIIFVTLYFTRIFVKIEWFVWYLGIIIFSSLLLILENFNWAEDIFNSYVFINLTQIWAIFLIIIWIRWLTKIYKKESIT